MITLNHPTPEQAAVQAQIEADIEAFLNAGGEIQQVPTGYGKDWSTGRSYIEIAKSEWALKQSTEKSKDAKKIQRSRKNGSKAGVAARKTITKKKAA